MNVYEIRDPQEARRHLLQSLWLSRTLGDHAAALPAALDWAMEIASEHHPVPLAGFVADLGHLALGSLHEPVRRPQRDVPGIDSAVVRKYEDYVLGKLYADPSFERGADALLRYQDRDRARAVAYLVNQLRERAGIGGVILVPTVLRKIQRDAEQSPGGVLAEAWRSIDEEGLSPEIVRDFEQLIDAVRSVGNVLGPEDVFELESGTALAQFGQRLALRQVLQAAEQLERRLPREKVRPRVRRQQVATQIVDEDLYPVGGYSSISTRGSMESLLHSQLSYMERSDRPDLFDVKFLRDELYYYSRDENQFWRRRQTFLFALHPDLVQARFKDAELPWQRIVLTLGLLIAAVKRLVEWLSDDALVFEFLFVQSSKAPALEEERALVETLLGEQIANGTVIVESLRVRDLPARCEERARSSLCHWLDVSPRDSRPPVELAGRACLEIAGPLPRVAFDEDPLAAPEEEGLDGWAEVLLALLRHWV